MIQMLKSLVVAVLRLKRKPVRVGFTEPRFLPSPAELAPRGARSGSNSPAPQMGRPLPNGAVAMKSPNVCHAPHRQGTAELLSDGHFGIGLIGVHEAAFVVKPPTHPSDSTLANRIASLHERVKMTPTRNIASGLRLGLEVLERAPRGRAGIVIIASGAPTTKPAWGRELVEMATARGTGVSVILLGSNVIAERALVVLTTKAARGFGSLRVANSSSELLEALRLSLDGLLPAFGMRGTNTAMLLVDCAEGMVESFGGATRVEMVVAALSEYLRNPLAGSMPKRLAA